MCVKRVSGNQPSAKHNLGDRTGFEGGVVGRGEKSDEWKMYKGEIGEFPSHSICVS